METAEPAGVLSNGCATTAWRRSKKVNTRQITPPEALRHLSARSTITFSTASRTFGNGAFKRHGVIQHFVTVCTLDGFQRHQVEVPLRCRRVLAHHHLPHLVKGIRRQTGITKEIEEGRTLAKACAACDCIRHFIWLHAAGFAFARDVCFLLQML